MGRPCVEPPQRGAEPIAEGASFPDSVRGSRACRETFTQPNDPQALLPMAKRNAVPPKPLFHHLPPPFACPFLPALPNLMQSRRCPTKKIRLRIPLRSVSTTTRSPSRPRRRPSRRPSSRRAALASSEAATTTAATTTTKSRCSRGSCQGPSRRQRRRRRLSSHRWPPPSRRQAARQAARQGRWAALTRTMGCSVLRSLAYAHSSKRIRAYSVLAVAD